MKNKIIGVRVMDESDAEMFGVYEKSWVYPVRQVTPASMCVWNSEPEKIIYFSSKVDQEKYYLEHEYCGRLPRCKRYVYVPQT